jgi:hypothetical protein
VRRIALQGTLQIVERTVEVVPVLAQERLSEQDFDRCIGARPSAHGRFRVAHVARIAFCARKLKIALRQGRGGGRIFRGGGERGAKPAQFGHGRIVPPSRQALEHQPIVLRQIGDAVRRCHGSPKQKPS